MEDEQQVQGLAHNGIHRVWLGRHREHHAEKIGTIVQRVVGIDKGLPDRFLIGIGGDGRDFGKETMSGQLDLLRVGRVVAVLVKRRKRADHGRQNRHGVCILGEPVVKTFHVFVQQRVPGDGICESPIFRLGGQVAVHQEVGGLQKIRLFGQLLNGNPPVSKNPPVSVDKRHAAGTGGGIHVPRVKGGETRLGA